MICQQAVLCCACNNLQLESWQAREEQVALQTTSLQAQGMAELVWSTEPVNSCRLHLQQAMGRHAWRCWCLAVLQDQSARLHGSNGAHSVRERQVDSP